MALVGWLLLRVLLLMEARIVRLPRPLISSLCSVDSVAKGRIALF